MVQFLEEIGNEDFKFEVGKKYTYLDGTEDITDVPELIGKILVRQPNSPKGRDWWCQFDKSLEGKTFVFVD